MKYEDYENISKGLTAENAPVIISQFLENIKTDLEERDAYKASLDEKESKIKDLQDTNIKLFLNQTAPEDKGPDPEEERAKAEEAERTRRHDEMVKLIGG